MTEHEVEFVYALLLDAGYGVRRSSWMAVSCPSAERCIAVIEQDIAAGHVPLHFETEQPRSES